MVVVGRGQSAGWEWTNRGFWRVWICVLLNPFCLRSGLCRSLIFAAVRVSVTLKMLISKFNAIQSNTLSQLHKSGLALPKKLKKGDKLTKAILAFALPCLLLLIQPVQGGSKTPTLQYGTFGRRNNAPSTHPPPVNDPTRGCNAANGCRQFTLSLENLGGTLVEAVGNVTVAEGTLNHREPGTEAIAAGIATWFLNKTESNSNTHGRLSISQDPISSAAVSSQMLQLQAVSRGIARMGLQVYTSMSTEDNSKIPPADGNIEIKVNSTSNMVDLRFFTSLEISLGEADIIHVLESAKTVLQFTRH
ncbi:hypothetical protein V6Z12_D10G239100 [Gossypium hirsutum]|uniref:Uncharacterized protein isoform X3 n=2 Tax=Gossypium TaxID=3633 RepID=A0A1U8KIH6_GOSHI|nr:uncharacterized protein LOC107915806 isoform X3 [Gossypium hirsutum]